MTRLWTCPPVATRIPGRSKWASHASAAEDVVAPSTFLYAAADMSTAALTVTIRRPVGDVFAVLTHLENASKWSRAVEETLTTSGPMGIGSRRRAVVRTFGGRTTQNEMELTEFQPDRRLAMRSISGFPFEVRISIDFVGLDDRTRLDWLVSFEPRRVLRPMGPILAAVYKRSFAVDLENLKTMMEAGTL